MATAKRPAPAGEAPMEDEFEYAAGWKPEPGAVIRGVVAELDMGYSEYGNYPIVTLTTDSGDVAVHAFHHTLRNKLEEVQPVKGDTLAIKYFGEVPVEGTKRRYHKYRIKSETAAQAGFWTSNAAPTPAPPEEDKDDIPF